MLKRQTYKCQDDEKGIIFHHIHKYALSLNILGIFKKIRSKAVELRKSSLLPVLCWGKSPVDCHFERLSRPVILKL